MAIDTSAFLNQAFSSQCITITITNDDICEPDETFNVTIIPDTPPPNLVLTSSSTTITIADDDGGNLD